MRQSWPEFDDKHRENCKKPVGGLVEAVGLMESPGRGHQASLWGLLGRGSWAVGSDRFGTD